MDNATDGGAGQVDLWLAFMAGPRTWREEGPLNAVETVSLGIEVAALAVGVSWPAMWASSRGGAMSREEMALLIGLVTATLLLLVAVVSPFGVWRRLSAPVAAGVRVTLGTLAGMCWAGLTPDLTLLGAWPLGVAAGSDVFQTAVALGVPLDPWGWLRRFAFSPASVVTVAVLGGLWVSGRAAGSRMALLGVVVVVIVVVAAATVAALRHWLTVMLAGREAVQREMRADQLRELGEWLHDTVCPQVRRSMELLEHGLADPEVIVRDLGELDQSLREHRLDGAIASGSIRMSEVLELYIRRAVRADIELQALPSSTVANASVDGSTAQLLKRTLGVLVNNAIEAGTTTLSLVLADSPTAVVIDVTDNAGGFDPDQVPAGRGFDRLRRALGENHLDVERVEGGTRVRATIMKGVTT